MVVRGELQPVTGVDITFFEVDVEEDVGRDVIGGEGAG